MDFATLDPAFVIERLRPPRGKLRMVLDTDTYNEIDDQFAVVHALLSPDRLDVEALYAAPFHNANSSGPEDGMERSYEEIQRLLERLRLQSAVRVLRGSRGYLTGPDAPQDSDAARDLVELGMAGPADTPLYVVAIGAITNVASALLLEPRLVERIIVVWLGGNPLYWPTAREFNLQQDLHASRLIFDCGVPLVQIPCQAVAALLHTTVPEIETHLAGRGPIADYLVKIFKDHHRDHYAWSKVIWDISTIGYLLNPDWVPTTLVHSPILTDQFTYSQDTRRHFIRIADTVHRDPIFRDLFGKIESHAQR